MVEMSSLKSEQQVHQHSTHVHPLTKIDDFGGFICNGCNTYGFGKTYRCASCNFDLHELCATCPPTLKCFMHPEHELKLVFKEPLKTDQNRRRCNICLELAEGLYYQCEACGFDMHPLWSQLPEKVSHVPHPAHNLELSDHGASNICMVCHGDIQSWRYKCGPCRLDVHMECVNSSASAPKGTQQKSLAPQPLPQQQGLGPQPLPQPYQYHQPQRNRNHISTLLSISNHHHKLIFTILSISSRRHKLIFTLVSISNHHHKLVFILISNHNRIFSLLTIINLVTIKVSNRVNSLVGVQGRKCSAFSWL